MSADIAIPVTHPTKTDHLKTIIEGIAADINLTDYDISIEEVDFSGDNFLGEIVRVKIIPKNESDTVYLIVKQAALAPSTRETIPLNTYYRMEIEAYSNILPTLYNVQENYNIPVHERFKFAKYFKGISEELKEMVILKNLTSDGYVMHNKRVPFDFEHASAILKYLARLHATSFVLKEKEPCVFNKLLETVPKTSNYSKTLPELCITYFKLILPLITNPEYKKKVEDFMPLAGENIENCLNSSLSEPYNIICHGDCWNNNMLFKYENGQIIDLVLVDWQVVRYASPTTDLAYMFCMSTEPHICRMDDLLELYYETLESATAKMGCDINKIFPKEVYRKHFLTHLLFGFGIGVCAIPTILGNPGEVKDLENAMEELNNDTFKIVFSDCAKARINSLVSYFVENDML